VERILRDVPWAKVVPMHCDLATLSSVASFAAEFRTLGRPLHLLVRLPACACSSAAGLPASLPAGCRKQGPPDLQLCRCAAVPLCLRSLAGVAA
jgi:hypothetical protein